MLLLCSSYNLYVHFCKVFEIDLKSCNAGWHSVIFLFIEGFHSQTCCPVVLLSKFSGYVVYFPQETGLSCKYTIQCVHVTGFIMWY